LAYYFSISKEEVARQQINIDSIAAIANEKERWLSNNTAVFKNKEGENEIDLQSKLSNGEALVDIIKYFDIDKKVDLYQALIATPTQINSTLIGKAKELDLKNIKLYKNGIKYKKSESRSYNAYWSPINEYLGGTSRIYLIKDGVYNQVSIGSLFDGSNYLADLYDVTILTNPEGLLAAKQNSSKAKNMFLMGSPAFDEEKFSPLPGTLKEVNGIASVADRNHLNTTKYIEKDATEQNFSKATTADILHVATHGFFIDKKQVGSKLSGEPILSNNSLDALMRSGIVLSEQGSSEDNGIAQIDDGLVTAYEISTLDFPSTELVVLSACETGLGEIKTGEGVYGLQRSFLVAGAQSVIMSLWKVDDNATKEFMITFYNNWLSNGKKHEAFNNAKRQLKNKFKEPYYWGAFVLIEG